MKSSGVADVRKVCYSALFTNLVRWHASAVSFPLSDVIMAQLACLLSDIMFCLHSGRTNLSLYIHRVTLPPAWADGYGHIFAHSALKA